MLRLVLDRPQRLNALTAPMLDALCDRVEEAEADAAVRAVVLTGAGRAFCAGADLQADSGNTADGRAAGPVAGREATLQAAHRAVVALRRLRKPVVAGVNGPAVGVGVALTLACDLVVADESAYFLLAFRDVGLMPDGGLTALLPAVVGRTRALEMSLLGERVPAATAQEWGMVTRVAEAGRFDEVLYTVARRVAEGPTMAHGFTKRAVDDAIRGLLAEAMEREIDSVGVLTGTADHAEGVAAFRERRPPVFRGA
ncbi:enoyl-CoA hydratase [Pseudonocardia halophobica]|uniref:Enoyl-CoA hydratase n=1 Tax=Pseudonocardia halophobica TaxID=29401 RepID=A0A9W6NUX3_9PSEU|nr:enoyl-CoA hydratase [Pseudonocardia halophobica]